MRTTVDIPDPLYRRLKSRAASEGSSAKELILRGVKRILKETPRKSRGRVKLPIIRSKRPGTLSLNNDKISTLFLFPDIDVWVALTYDRHARSPAVRNLSSEILQLSVCPQGR